MSTTPKLTQAETARHLIRTEILDGRLSPGAKLNIKSLEDRLQVSLGAIREALSRLSAEGMVDAEAHRGYRVSTISAEDLIDLTETRIQIESLCLSKAISQGDVEWETRIVGAAHRMERLQHSPSDPVARVTDNWNQAHGEFHEALVSACPSAWLHRLRKLLYEQSERYRRLSVPLDTDNRDVREEHRRIMDAVLRRDTPAALQELERHLSVTTQIILRSPLLQVKQSGG
ncbi:transcriptional regulator [Pollutimonas subterranea]|jgi:GntR family carbon starvation induced transcriptional regulator|uniref:Transcriptional regulator n=1 Tax=Pollutimonas subterranea TaxID=2045210 RepID=A0A2N4U256_9BURK|nr:GntR family transcriptional regulator [Pollutimonas subterranea]PLC49098.1 transcriptional regulator [Pollutimonas subterranea]